MSAEETLMQIRREKHQQLNSGTYPLTRNWSEEEKVLYWGVAGYLKHYDHLAHKNELVTTIDPAEIHTEYKFLVHGRITNFRKSGSITFLKVADSTGSIQILVSKSAFPNYEGLKQFDLGDFIEVLGLPCLSRTGEKSVLAEDIKLLTKSHRVPPEKFAGIADTELKSRKRYLDLMSSEETRARFTVRTYLIRGIRQYMDERNYLEVETSTLNTVSGGANAKPFTTHHNALDIDLTLRIAPELYLKRLLVGGLDKVYEIGRDYRNEGIDTRHNPEFTTIESYEAYGHFDDLIIMTKAMIRSAQDYCEMHLPSNILPYFEKWKANRPFSLSQFTQVTMLEAVHKACSKAGIHLEWNGLGEGIHDYKFSVPGNERLNQIDTDTMDINLVHAKSPGEELAILFEHVAEPFLTEDYRSGDDLHSQCVFITEYPKDICPLARANDKNPLVCDRFELFIEGRELANAFQELNDPDEQARRFNEQLKTNDKDPMDYDADYVEALEYGMPPAIGFGMGIDRLVMLMTNTSSIKDVILFPTLRPEK